MWCGRVCVETRVDEHGTREDIETKEPKYSVIKQRPERHLKPLHEEIRRTVRDSASTTMPRCAVPWKKCGGTEDTGPSSGVGKL